MRLSKITYHIGFKNGAHKFEQQQQQQQLEHTAKLQATAGGKRYSGSHSNNSNSNCGSARGSGSGSGSAVSGGVATNNRSSIGNGSCVSTSTTSAATAAAAASTGKRRKSKPTKCFSSTVFRCCIPCRGGGSAAPATSPPHSPATPADDVNNGTSITAAAQKKYAKAAYEKKRDSGTISAPYAELDADGDVDVDAEAAAAVAANGKKHSLADTIATSATTPISLKTIINDSDELEPPTLSVADIAAATLATGIVARKAEPETLSDASVSPTAAIQQLPFLGTHINAASGLNAIGSAALNISAQQISPTKTTSNVPTVTSFTTALGQASNPTTLQQQQQTQQQQVPPPPPPAAQSAPRVSQSQTSPLPHIKEEEESEHIGNRHQYSPPVDAEQAVGGAPNTVSDSSESTNAPQSTNTSFSAPASGHQELVTPSASTPSPRIKLKFRKQHKSAWSRSVLTPGSASSGVAGGGGSAGGSSGGGGAGGGSGSGGATSNETLASNGSNTNTATSVSSGGLHRISLSSVPHASSSAQLLPATKMQAEQGSIGDLQKYHSRYLKNRRHTLANVR